ncbi:ATP-dependent DNA helicase Q 1 [Spatholobus suberectus]|nr:ATP-dependent DNA helicase Q 1 [Spatholobus suberectus]
MEFVQHRQPQSYYGGKRQIQQHIVNVRTIHDNKMRIERSRGRTSPYGSYYEPSPRRERKHYGSMSPPHKSRWNDNESKRKRRVAKYKFYEAEGKAKSSLKEGFRSFKITCMKIVANF